jgi:hypothetical protein
MARTEHDAEDPPHHGGAKCDHWRAFDGMAQISKEFLHEGDEVLGMNQAIAPKAMPTMVDIATTSKQKTKVLSFRVFPL